MGSHAFNHSTIQRIETEERYIGDANPDETAYVAELFKHECAECE
jgi:hypothetical protein